jgi:hypothetical protein
LAANFLEIAAMSLLLVERPPVLAPRTVRGSMLFIEPDDKRPTVIYRDGAAPPEASAPHRAYETFIRDARAAADQPQLDREGFALVPHISSVRDFDDEDEVLKLGREEVADLVAAATGAAHVFVFDHTRRRRAPDAERQPSTRVHVDYTENSAPQRLRDFFGPGAALAKRVAFINVWRPVRWAADDWPLALADARSVEPSDLIATDIIYPDRRGEIYGLRYNPAQRWSYFPRMQLDEALLIKCYDSRTDVARFTPHTAFADPATPPDAPPRQSIEFRTIAFFT